MSYNIAKILKLSHKLRANGFDKYADDLEYKFLILKKSETKLYSVFKETGEDVINEAHPEGSPNVLSEAKELAVFENLLLQKKKMLEVANKNPNGKFASKITKSAAGSSSAMKKLLGITSYFDNLFEVFGLANKEALTKDFAKAMEVARQTRDPNELQRVINTTIGNIRASSKSEGEKSEAIRKLEEYSKLLKEELGTFSQSNVVMAEVNKIRQDLSTRLTNAAKEGKSGDDFIQIANEVFSSSDPSIKDNFFGSMALNDTINRTLEEKMPGLSKLRIDAGIKSLKEDIAKLNTWATRSLSGLDPQKRDDILIRIAQLSDDYYSGNSQNASRTLKALEDSFKNLDEASKKALLNQIKELPKLKILAGVIGTTAAYVGISSAIEFAGKEKTLTGSQGIDTLSKMMNALPSSQGSAKSFAVQYIAKCNELQGKLDQKQPVTADDIKQLIELGKKVTDNLSKYSTLESVFEDKAVVNYVNHGIPTQISNLNDWFRANITAASSSASQSADTVTSTSNPQLYAEIRNLVNEINPIYQQKKLKPENLGKIVTDVGGTVKQWGDWVEDSLNKAEYAKNAKDTLNKVKTFMNTLPNAQ